MDPYTIFTDSGCDLSPQVMTDWGLGWACLTFHFEEEGVPYRNYDLPAGAFYARMHQGWHALTAAVNPDAFRSAFRPALEAGRDILYLGFSSGLSCTYQSACAAAEALRGEFPQRRIRTVDTLCASAGQALLLYLTLREQAAGADLDEAAQFALDTRLHIAHWFTVDDLKYLRRGGRISAAAAVVGSVLGIKPILHMDTEGHLAAVGKVRGRKASLRALADQIGVLAGEGGVTGPIFACHGDCAGDIETLRAMVQEQYGLPIELVTDVGPVIGSHSGPGTISLFFLARER